MTAYLNCSDSNNIENFIIKYACCYGYRCVGFIWNYNECSNALVTAGLFQNINASCVEEAEKLKRLKMKSSHDAKLERDRMSRQLQQQRTQERKEKEKKRTQKQERRR